MKVLRTLLLSILLSSVNIWAFTSGLLDSSDTLEPNPDNGTGIYITTTEHQQSSLDDILGPADPDVK